jgi:hypothetical protein
MCLTPSRFEVNQRFSPLLRLPAELRIKIYEYATTDLKLDLSDLRKPFTERISISTALTKTSRQLYIETRAMTVEVTALSGTVDTLLHAFSRCASHGIRLDAVHTVTVHLFPPDAKGFFSGAEYLTRIRLIELFKMLPEIKHVTAEGAVNRHPCCDSMAVCWRGIVSYTLGRSGRMNVEVQVAPVRLMP